MRVEGFRLIPLFTVFLLMFSISQMVYSAEEAKMHSQPEINHSEWRVGIAVFITTENDPSLASAASLIPRLIRDEISGIKTHRLSDEDKIILVQKSIDLKVLESYSSLSKLFSKRDELLFDLNANPSTLKSLDGQIDLEFTNLRYWLDSVPDPAAVPDFLPVTFPAPPEGGEIWDSDNASSEAFRTSVNLDVLVIGEIVRVGDYFGLKISALSSAGEGILWEGAGGDSELEEISAEAGAAARRLILGRSWSSLTIQSEPSDAVISVNGKSVGVGFWSDSTLVPGDMILEVTAAGYAPKIIIEEMVPNEIRVIDVKLEKTDQAQILIRSIPTGASVRLGSIWLGRAPLSVTLPDRVVSLTLEKEGFRTRTVPLYPDAERLTVPLDYILVDPMEELKDSRKKLNNSIAWFSFSLAPTIILLGVSQNYANMNFNSTTPEDYEYSYKAYKLSYGLMWGSVAINVGLLTNVLFKLSRYLKAAEELSD